MMLRWSFSVYEPERDQKRGAQSIIFIYLMSANDEKLGYGYYFLKSDKIS